MGKSKDKKKVEINQRQKDFCRFYIETKWKKEEAAILAGYSKKTAYSQANRLLKNVRVQKYLNELIEDDMGMGRGQLRHAVLSELKAIAFADTSNDINVVTKTQKIPRKNDKGEIIPGEFEDKEYQDVVMIDTKDSKQTKAIKSISQDRYGVIKIEYYDKESALDKLGKYGGLWKDTPVVVDNSVDNSVTNIDYSSLTEEEAKNMFLDATNKK